MKLPRRGLIITLGLVGVLAFVALRFFPNEPTYNGKPLSAWSEQYGSNHWTIRQAAAQDAEVAIRQIGTNGIPFLLAWSRTSDSAMKAKLREIFPRRWHGKLRLEDRSRERRSAGAHGLSALGTNAASAVPALIEIARQHPDQHGRYLAVFTLRNLGDAAAPAVPFFIQCLTNSDMTVRDEAATGLAVVRRHPEIVVPALHEYLESIKANQDGWAIRGAIHALAQFGTNARPAVPLLVLLLKSESMDVREAVTNCLPMIDEEAARNNSLVRHR